jgi:hypothetical protein
LGGGIFAAAPYGVEPLPQPRIEGNIFEDNVAGQNGGGLALINGVFEVRGNVFRGNHCVADGGGVWVWMLRGQFFLTNNEFFDNVAGDHGGGVYASGSPSTLPYTIERNLFVGNRTTGVGHIGDSGSGGGIAALVMRGVISHNTLVGNDGHHLTHSGGGGMLLWGTGTDLVIFGNIVALNWECGVSCWGDGTTATMGPNLLWANDGGDLGTGPGECPSSWIDVLLLADPLFCDPENGDHRVASNSPAVDGEEVMGAFSEPGCGPRDVTPAETWNRLKTLYSD